MKYLITGGAGFLGSALANSLVDGGHEVRVIDNLRTGRRESLCEQVLFTHGDVADIPKMWTLLQDIDCVYHLAARVAVAESIQYPRDYNHDNVGGTVSIMEAMRDVGVKRVVFTSSGAIYGEQHVELLSENLTPDPGSPYAVSKLAAESYIRTIGRLWGIETVSLRVFNAYGPNQLVRPSHPPVIPHFLKSALAGSSVVIHGTGEQTRDFIYIDDVVTALKNAALSDGVDREILNIGSGVGTSINELAEIISLVSGRKLSLIINSQREMGVSKMCADIEKAGQLLNFKPEISLEGGISKLLALDTQFQVSD